LSASAASNPVQPGADVLDNMTRAVLMLELEHEQQTVGELRRSLTGAQDEEDRLRKALADCIDSHAALSKVAEADARRVTLLEEARSRDLLEVSNLEQQRDQLETEVGHLMLLLSEQSLRRISNSSSHDVNSSSPRLTSRSSKGNNIGASLSRMEQHLEGDDSLNSSGRRQGERERYHPTQRTPEKRDANAVPVIDVRSIRKGWWERGGGDAADSVSESRHLYGPLRG